MTTDILYCRNLTYSYSGQTENVFSDISFSLKEGEAVLLMGNTGSGKSTLSYCLSGLYPQYAGSMTGQIVLDGKDLSSYGPAARSKIASILFQNPDNQFCMDHVDNEVLFALENINYQGNLRQRMSELLSLVGLSGFERHRIFKLSGGQKQKLALATALATQARVLILDEPFANLDPLSCRELSTLLEKLNRENGISMLIVDHKVSWWRSFISRVVFMAKTGNLDESSVDVKDLDEKASLFRESGLFLEDDWTQGHRPHQVMFPDEIALEAENLCIYHDKKNLFMKDLSFRIPKGSTTVLCGLSGSGKTTLLQALCSIGRTEGKLSVSSRVGLVFQNPRFQFITLTVESEIIEALRTSEKNLSDEDLKKKAHEYLSEFSLLEKKDNSPYEISQGQQRRLALLSMLCCDCQILLLDEPTYAQDEISTRFIMRLLEKRIEKGLTVIMATHDIHLARSYANTIYCIRDRKMIRIDETELESVYQKEDA